MLEYFVNPINPLPNVSGSRSIRTFRLDRGLTAVSGSECSWVPSPNVLQGLVEDGAPAHALVASVGRKQVSDHRGSRFAMLKLI